MALTLSAITLNSADPRRTAAFWTDALGGSWRDRGTGPTDVHLDLNADDPAHEVAQLVAVGAELVAERSDSHGSWTVLRDPDDLVELGAGQVRAARARPDAWPGWHNGRAPRQPTTA